MTPLRAHQTLALEMLRGSFSSGHRRPLLMLPTGGGKTMIAARMIAGAVERGRKVAFIAPLATLIDQALACLQREGIEDIGVIAGDHPMTRPDAAVQIISAQTLARRHDRPAIDFAVIDECHLQHDAVTAWLREIDVPCVGLSASPYAPRLGNFFDDLVAPVTMAELVAAGFLVDYDCWAPETVDMSGVSTRGGEFATGESSTRMMAFHGAIAKAWRAMAWRKPTIVFAVDVAHATALTAYFNDHSDAIAEIVTGETSLSDRARIKKRLEGGYTDVLVSVSALSAGFDAPAVSCAVLARPTKSAMVFQQQVGRVLRPHPGKAKALVLDFCGAHDRFGFADQLSISTLSCDDEPSVKTGSGASSMPTCPSCAALRRRGTLRCDACGHEAERPKPVLVENVELQKLVRDDSRKARNEFLGAMLHIAAARGYSEGWAKFQFRERYGDWPSRNLRVAPRKPSAEHLDHFEQWRAAARNKLRFG